MKGVGVFLLLFFNSYLSIAQYDTLDFEDSFQSFATYGGCAFQVVQDPQNAQNNVGQISNSGNLYEGSYIDVASRVNIDSIKVLTLDFHQTLATNSQVKIKLEDDKNTDVEVVETVTSSGWSSLSFDFSNATEISSGITINANGSYTRLVVVVNDGLASTGTYMIDDIVYPNYTLAHSLDVMYSDLVYAEEFNYFGAVDTNDWFQEVVPPNSWGWFNGEYQHYTNRIDNSYLSNGTLKIVAKKETYTDYGLTLDYTSARLNSKFNFTYGRIDVRAKLPIGHGTWPAIWMLGTSLGNHWHPHQLTWPDCGEIDIMEHWGHNQNVIHGSIHTISSNGSTVNTGSLIDGDVSDKFHVYSVNWSPNQISFLMDGVLYYTYNPPVKDATTWPFDDPQFIILNVAMGGSFFSIDPNFVESEMEIDYVRVFQNVSGQTELATHGFKVYPNPTDGEVYLDAAQPMDMLELFDLSGKKVMEFNSNVAKVDISTLPKGLYLLKVYMGNDSFTQRVLKI